MEFAHMYHRQQHCGYGQLMQLFSHILTVLLKLFICDVNKA